MPADRTPTLVARVLALSSALLLAGCTAHHYVVLEEAPLYVDAAGEAVLTTLPRYHHEDLGGDPQRVGGRLALTYRGQRGWAEPGAVRVFTYLDPLWDGGEDRQATVRRALREAQIAHVGRDWDPAIRAAVRDGEVRAGMTRQQVELAWGWPLTVEPASDGGERWVYRTHRTETLHQFLSDPWSYPSSSLSMAGWHGCASTTDVWGWPRSGWVELRLSVTEERLVRIDAEGVVQGVRVRRFLNDA